MRLLSRIEELRAGVAVLAACLEAAAEGRVEAPLPEETGPEADFLRAYA